MASIIYRPPPVASLAVVALCIAILARLLWGYPVCKAEDEYIWAYILSLRDKGVSPPISGPAFVWATEGLRGLTAIPHSLALAAVGTLAIPLLVVAMAWAYRSITSTSLLLVGLSLACTTYFWAPFMLSRPQQWGQVCFLVGNVMAWRFLKGRASWVALTAVFLVTSLTHILSFALLCASAILIATVLAFLRQSGLAAATRLLASVVIGAVPLLLPGGPYVPLIEEIFERHVLVSTESLLIVPPAVIAGIAASLGMHRPFSRGIDGLAASCLNWLDRHPGRALSVACAGIVVALGWQAWILSSEAWVPYGDSLALFAFSQLGNVFFLGLTLCGVSCARRKHLEGHGEEWMATFGLFLLCSGVLAAAALLGSFALRDTNWMLRVLNYGVLMAAPFAALGLKEFQRRHPLQWLPATVMLVSVSYLSSIRASFLFYC